MKFPALSGDHRLGQEAGDSEVPPRGRKLLETAQMAGLNQDCYMSENPTTTRLPYIKVSPYLVS